MSNWSYIFSVPLGASRTSISAQIDNAPSLDWALDEANLHLNEASSDTLGIYVADGFTKDDLYRIICHSCGACVDYDDRVARDIGYDDNWRNMVAYMEDDEGCNCDKEDDDG